MRLITFFSTRPHRRCRVCDDRCRVAIVPPEERSEMKLEWRISESDGKPVTGITWNFFLGCGGFFPGWLASGAISPCISVAAGYPSDNATEPALVIGAAESLRFRSTQSARPEVRLP